MVPLYIKSGDKLKCILCPHYCILKSGNTGICRVRKNTGDEIELMTYGTISGYALDPVEKKPLYHFFPGHKILSIGSYGCNMRCDFCQNYHISQITPDNMVNETTPEEIVSAALKSERNIGIAFTYNEPVIWFEFMRDTAIAARKKGLNTVMVSNGYVNKEPLEEIISFTDAFNIDLKAFNNSFYKKLTGADIEPVKNTMKQIAKSGKHLEITTLVISGENEDKTEMTLQSEWIAGELGKDVPFHLSRYHPMYKRDNPATSADTMNRLFELASRHLDYVYMGNTSSAHGQDTKCPGCGTIVTERTQYQTRLLNLDKEGRCLCCGRLIYKNIIIT